MTLSGTNKAGEPRVRPIAVMSFDRPHYLESVLYSLKSQNVPIDPDRIMLFQDGYRSKSGRDVTDASLVERCVKLFSAIFPGGRIFQSEVNLGVALNFARAETFMFDDLAAEAAYFFEDDLVLSSPHYVTALESLTKIALTEKRIAYVAAYGDHRATLAEQRLAPGKLIRMRNKWGFALTRRQWIAQREILEPYLEIISRADYRDRDHKAIREYYRKLGYGSPGTSQDGMKDVASCILGTTKIMTYACFGRYIGEIGLHSNRALFDEEKFGQTDVYFDEIPSFSPVSDGDLAEWIALERANGKKALEFTRTEVSSASHGAATLRELPLVPVSGESQNPHITDEMIVRAIYRVLLLREPDPRGLNSGRQQLRSGRSIEELMGWCLRSSEFAEKHRKFLEAYVNKKFLEMAAVQPPVETMAMPSLMTRRETMAPTDTELYWERRYRGGGNSGGGSYGHLARYKARFLNRFVSENRIKSVAELGCGDGEQLRRANYPEYTGYDISLAAVTVCREKFANDPTKTFFALGEVGRFDPADLSLSLDVVYHLLEDDVFEDHVRSLFRIATRNVIIYGNGCVGAYDADHIKLRDFNDTIRRLCPGWSLMNAERNPFYSDLGINPDLTWSNFYVYQAPPRSWHSVFRAAVPQLVMGNVGTAEPDTYMALALRANPRLTVDIVVIKEAEAAFQAVIEEFPGRVRLVVVSAWVNGVDLHSDLIFFATGVIEHTRVAELRRLVKSCKSDTILLVALPDGAVPTALAEAITGGYVKEILPEMRGCAPETRRPGPQSTIWVGSVQVEPMLIVSMTTIRARLKALEQVLASIINQSLIADRIVLNISAEAYLQDEGIPRSMLPAKLLSYENAGLVEINYVENTGPYRKLLPTLRAEWSSNCVIVTCDDDTIYPPHWLDHLYTTFLKKRSIVACRYSNFLIDGGRPRPYLDWAKPLANAEVSPEFADVFTFPTGKGGILYHPEFFTEDVFDPELIRIAPTTDDLTFKLATMITHTPVTRVPRSLSGIGILDEFPAAGKQDDGLWGLNRVGRNDESLANLLDYLKLKKVLDISQLLRLREGVHS